MNPEKQNKISEKIGKYSKIGAYIFGIIDVAGSFFMLVAVALTAAFIIYSIPSLPMQVKAIIFGIVLIFLSFLYGK